VGFGNHVAMNSKQA